MLVAGFAVDLYRKCVRTWLADQSKESKFALKTPAEVLYHLCPCVKLSTATPGSNELLFPDCLTIYDHLHIYNNSLQTAVEALDWWLVFKEAVSSFCAVFGAKIHIGRFLAVCNLPQWARRQTKKFKLRIVDWRWEVLEVVLEDLQFMWPVICFFDLALMRGGSKVSNALYTAIADAFRDPAFLPRVAMLHCVCHRIGHWSRWTEGCSCHWEAIAHCTTWGQRKAVLIALGIPDGEQKAASSFQF